MNTLNLPCPLKIVNKRELLQHDHTICKIKSNEVFKYVALI